ncbi:MAG: glucose 1-dehydrogenase [Actinobacteria bacterium]|uniref:Unannotated protein n=1 Tax=freshwater metagenome TaxID=449393 RepID=A0A6J6ZZN3_9ZZZZ|nr:glucose 1-dehydrogenase [Actinomycetota bacterium]
MSDQFSAIITGGGSGIGKASALALAGRGFAVVVADISMEAANETVAAIKAAGQRALARRVDVTNSDELMDAVSAATETFGPLRAAVNSAGIQGTLAPAEACTEPNWNAIIGVNLTGTWLSMKSELAAMLAGGGGSIINISSNFGLVGQRGMPAYCASKHGVIGLTKSAALDYADRGIRVNAVCPGPINTPLLEAFTIGGGSEILDSIKLSVPMKRIGTSEEVAQAVAWLASEEASYVTGAALSVDGGYVVP